MAYIITIIIIAIVLFFSRNYLKNIIISFIEKRNNQKVTEKRDIFSPVGAVRTFTVNLEIEELGGDIEIRLAKKQL